MTKMIGIVALLGLAGATARAQVVDVSTVPYDGSAQASGPPTARDGLDDWIYLENTLGEGFFVPALWEGVVEIADDIHNDLPMVMSGFSVTWWAGDSATVDPRSVTINFYENDADDNAFVAPPITAYTITGLTTGFNTTTVKVNTVVLPANIWMGVMFSHDDMGMPLASDFWPEVGQPSHDLLLIRLENGDIGLEFGSGYEFLTFNFLVGVFGESIPEPATLVLLGLCGLITVRRRSP